MNVVKLNIKPDLSSIEADRMLIAETSSYIRNLWEQVRAAEMYIAAGGEFKALHGHLSKNSKHDVNRIGWVRAFSKDENRFGCSRQQAETYITIYEAFFHVANMLATWRLPQSLRPLATLAKLKLSGDRLLQLVDSGKVGPHSTESEIRALRQKPKKKKNKLGQIVTGIPARNAPKQQRIDAALEIIAKLGLTINDLIKEPK